MLHPPCLLSEKYGYFGILIKPAQYNQKVAEKHCVPEHDFRLPKKYWYTTQQELTEQTREAGEQVSDKKPSAESLLHIGNLREPGARCWIRSYDNGSDSKLDAVPTELTSKPEGAQYLFPTFQIQS